MEENIRLKQKKKSENAECLFLCGNIGRCKRLNFKGKSPKESMATHSCILAWVIPMGRGAWWITVHRSQSWI